MLNQILEKRIAELESLNDQMYTELCYVDKLMRMIGFSEGLETVKITAQEIQNGDIGLEFGEDDNKM